MTFLILFFVWVGAPDAQPPIDRVAFEASLNARCNAMHDDAFLLRYHAPVRKYRFTWKGAMNEQKVFPGFDYFCVLETSTEE